MTLRSFSWPGRILGAFTGLWRRPRLDPSGRPLCPGCGKVHTEPTWKVKPYVEDTNHYYGSDITSDEFLKLAEYAFKEAKKTNASSILLLQQLDELGGINGKPSEHGVDCADADGSVIGAVKIQTNSSIFVQTTAILALVSRTLQDIRRLDANMLEHPNYGPLLTGLLENAAELTTKFSALAKRGK